MGQIGMCQGGMCVCGDLSGGAGGGFPAGGVGGGFGLGGGLPFP